MPLRKFDGHALGAGKEDQLARMKIHDLVASLEAVGPHLRHFSFDILHRKADVIEAELLEVADMGIVDGRGLPVVQQLDLRPWRRTL